MYLKIQSKNELVKEALSLMGASTKRADKSKIGMFGTGNKYALAYLLRNEYEMDILSGIEKVVLGTNDVALGEETFKVITIDGKETSLTTELGKDWELWMAIRELYSNAVDEGLTGFSVVKNKPRGRKGHTTIILKMTNELSNFWLNVSDYLAINKNVLFENEVGRIYAKHSTKTCVYRHGIKVINEDRNSLFDYEVGSIDVTEERIAKYSFQAEENMWKLIYACDNELVIRSILQNATDNDIYERCIGHSWMSTYPHMLSDTWKNILEEIQVAPDMFKEYIQEDEIPITTIVPDKLYHDLISITGNQVKKPRNLTISDGGCPYKPYPMSDTESNELNKAVQFLNDSSFDIPYPIQVVEFKNKQIMGSINEDVILIGSRNFSEGDHYIVNTILEEYIHIKHGVHDETRAFQTAAINELVTYMKLKTNESN